jgi:prepilin-type N-terminal cleavage/methylation domain-containing protein
MSIKSLREKPYKRQAGFTLIEVMVAIVILAVSISALFNFQSNSVLASARAAKIAVATLLTREQMALSLLELESAINKGEALDEKSDEGTFDQDIYPGYRWELTVRKIEIPPPPLPDEGAAAVVQNVAQMITDSISQAVREVRLKVYWQELENQEEEMEVVTHIIRSRTGVGNKTVVETGGNR